MAPLFITFKVIRIQFSVVDFCVTDICQRMFCQHAPCFKLRLICKIACRRQFGPCCLNCSLAGSFNKISATKLFLISFVDKVFSRIDLGVQGRDTVWASRWVPPFPRDVLPPSRIDVRS
jgi:hypothetical protein